MSGLDDHEAVRGFVEDTCDAYRKLMGLDAEIEVAWKLGQYGTGTVQITLRQAPPADPE